MMKLTVAFDIDGVLRNLVRRSIEVLNPDRIATQQITMGDVKRYANFNEFFDGPDHWKQFAEKNDVWRSASDYHHMWSIMRLIKEWKHKVIIVTANDSTFGKVATLDWLAVHMAQLADSRLDHIDIHFTRNKLNVHWDAIIEDCPKHAKMAIRKGRMCFLVERPWTRDLVEQDPHNRIQEREQSTPLLIRLPEDGIAHTMIKDGLTWYQGYKYGKKS